MTNYRDAVAIVARDLGYSHYASQVEGITRLFESRAPDSQIISTLVGYGATRPTAEQAVERVRRLASDSEVEAAPTFDRATAASVIRAFITDGSAHLSDDLTGGGFDEEQVTALLVLAGLEDEPEPEPEPESEATTDDHESVIQRLVTWARGRGFTG